MDTTKTDTVPKKKILKPLLIMTGIALLLFLGLFGSRFVKHSIAAYNNIGIIPLQVYAPEIVTPVQKSEIYSDEDVRRALEITQKEALHYLDGSDWSCPWRTAWVVKIWYDPAAADDEIEDKAGDNLEKGRGRRRKPDPEKRSRFLKAHQI